MAEERGATPAGLQSQITHHLTMTPLCSVCIIHLKPFALLYKALRKYFSALRSLLVQNIKGHELSGPFSEQTTAVLLQTHDRERPLIRRDIQFS